MMTRQQQAAFRPLVDKAWERTCLLTGRPLNDRAAKDAWYREQLISSPCHIRSTREATARQVPVLMEVFKEIAGAVVLPDICGWSEAQNDAFHHLAKRAFQSRLEYHQESDIQAWLSSELKALLGDQLFLMRDGIVATWHASKKEGFDHVMSHFAVLANDARWIDRLAGAAERRMRWQITRFLADLSWLEGTEYGWEYVRAIYDQAALYPSIDDAPAEQLLKALQMLDTHIRRKCRERGIRPCDIPSRDMFSPAFETVAKKPVSNTPF